LTWWTNYKGWTQGGQNHNSAPCESSTALVESTIQATMFEFLTTSAWTCKTITEYHFTSFSIICQWLNPLWLKGK